MADIRSGNREPFEHVRDRNDPDSGVIFDRRLYTPHLYERPDKPERLRVYHEPGESMIDIEIESTSSELPTAECTEVGDKLVLTTDQVRWLHGQLGSLIARWDEGRE